MFLVVATSPSRPRDKDPKGKRGESAAGKDWCDIPWVYIFGDFWAFFRSRFLFVSIAGLMI